MWKAEEYLEGWRSVLGHCAVGRKAGEYLEGWRLALGRHAVGRKAEEYLKGWRSVFGHRAVGRKAGEYLEGWRSVLGHRAVGRKAGQWDRALCSACEQGVVWRWAPHPGWCWGPLSLCCGKEGWAVRQGTALSLWAGSSVETSPASWPVLGSPAEEALGRPAVHLCSVPSLHRFLSLIHTWLPSCRGQFGPLPNTMGCLCPGHSCMDRV